MTEHLKICFDKILPRDFNRPHRALALGDPMRAILVIRKMWPNGSTLRVRFMGGTHEQQLLAQEQAGWWEDGSVLRRASNQICNELKPHSIGRTIVCLFGAPFISRNFR